MVPTVTQVRHGRAFIRLRTSHRKMSTWNPGLGLIVMHDVMGITSNESGLNFYQGSSGGVHIRPTDGWCMVGKVEIRGKGRGLLSRQTLLLAI